MRGGSDSWAGAVGEGKRSCSRSAENSGPEALMVLPVLVLVLVAVLPGPGDEEAEEAELGENGGGGAKPGGGAMPGGKAEEDMEGRIKGRANISAANRSILLLSNSPSARQAE